jgi:hypothetical protein
MQIFCDAYQKVCSGNSVKSGKLEMGFSTSALFLLAVLSLYGDLCPITCSVASIVPRYTVKPA